MAGGDTNLPPGGGFLIAPVGSERIDVREDLGDEQREFYRTARRFATDRVLPNAARIEAKDFALDRELIREAGAPIVLTHVAHLVICGASAPV